MVDFVKKASLLCLVRDITEPFIGKFTLTDATTKGEICSGKAFSSFILDKALVLSIDINCSNISRAHFYSSVELEIHGTCYYVMKHAKII